MSYYALVLDQSPYPSDFPEDFRLAYVPESKQLVVEYELPGFDVIPSVGSYKYTKTTGKVTETARPLAQRKSLYTESSPRLRSAPSTRSSAPMRPGTWRRSCSMGTFTRSIPAPASRFTLVSLAFARAGRYSTSSICRRSTPSLASRL